MRTQAATVGALLLLLAGAGQAQQAVGSALFYVHSTQVYQYGVPLGLLRIAKDWSVTTTGTTSSIVRYGAVQLRFGPFVQSRLGTAPSDVFGQLTSAFNNEHVGTLTGNCMAFPAGPDGSYRLEMTWYGRGGRTNQLIVSSDFTDPCSPSVQSLVTALVAFERAMIDPVLPVR
jgi:hypothetical protein